MSKDRLIIFDTTMRDGEQSPGASMTRDEKIRIARSLERLNVDVIEAGFAIASPGDFEAVKAVAETVKNCAVASLARAAYRDIEEAAAALKNAVRPRIHTFIATSPIHMQYKLQMTPEQVLDQAVRSVKQARTHTDDVEFSCEDASRSEFDFLCRVIEAVIAAGAGTINLPDTVGYGEPGQYGEFVGRLIRTVPNADKAIFSVHCHNDLGLAVANSLSAVMHGARQVECTINGLGERAGNASLEEIVMAVRTRADVFPVETRIVTEEIVPASRLVSSITGFPVQPNKAIVGANAFAHEAGIHQDGVLKHRETYEIMRAQDVGWSTNRLVLGKHSGRAAVRARFEELGISFETPEELESAFKRFKELADKKHEIFDEDLQAIAGTVGSEDEAERYQFVALEAISHTGEKPRATVTLSIDGVERQSYAEGDGPVDAVFKAIENEVHSGTKLLLFSINAITTGTDSQAEVMVRLERDARIVNGAGADTDIIVASAKAYLHALNVMGGAVRAHPQIGGI
ncbi:MAG: 2-isopropylmalate synthase [Pseudomonadales bacterium]|nr:2-isopropylmalate synthase [Pseudomonadales bacterium]MBP7911370.1 2-isopropylmalate synthase [Pseudomonadales bacterium]